MVGAKAIFLPNLGGSIMTGAALAHGFMENEMSSRAISP